jgi:hypothetical protein
MAELYAGQPVFPGTNGAAQLYAIAAVLGPITPAAWSDGARHCAAAGIRTNDVSSGTVMGGLSLTPPRDRVAALCVGATTAALDVICACLQWDPAKRPSAADALDCEFFAPIFGSNGSGAGDVTPMGTPIGLHSSYTEFSGVDTPGASEWMASCAADVASPSVAAARDWRASSRSPVPLAGVAGTGPPRRPSLASLSAAPAVTFGIDGVAGGSSSGCAPPPLAMGGPVGGPRRASSVAALNATPPQRDAAAAAAADTRFRSTRDLLLPELPACSAAAAGVGGGLLQHVSASSSAAAAAAVGGADLDLVSLSADIDTDLRALGLGDEEEAGGGGGSADRVLQPLPRAPPPAISMHHAAAAPAAAVTRGEERLWPGRSPLVAPSAGAATAARAAGERRPPTVVATEAPAAAAVDESSFEDLLSEIERQPL